MPGAGSVHTINHHSDKLSLTYNSRWKTSNQASDSAALLIIEMTFFIANYNRIGKIRIVLCFAISFKNYGGLKIIIRVFCVFIGHVDLCWIYSTPRLQTPEH